VHASDVPTYLATHLTIYLSIHLPTYLSIPLLLQRHFRGTDVRPSDMSTYLMIMLCLPPQGTPPPKHSSRHGPQRTQHTASTAATPRYPQGRRQIPADAPTPLKRSMLALSEGPDPATDLSIHPPTHLSIHHQSIA